MTRNKEMEFSNLDNAIVSDINGVERNLLTKEIHSVQGNLLQIDIAAGITGKAPKNFNGIEGVFPITITEQSAIYRLIFPNFVAYSVTDEMFAQEGKDEVGLGNWIKIYTQSNFLKFVRSATWASEDFPGKLLHYQINTLDHTIDVVTAQSAQVMKL